MWANSTGKFELSLIPELWFLGNNSDPHLLKGILPVFCRSTFKVSSPYRRQKISEKQRLWKIQVDIDR